MIDIKTVMAKANSKYVKARPRKVCMESEQIRALAESLVEEINKELSLIQHHPAQPEG